MGRFLASSSVKEEQPIPSFVIMATSKDFKNKALNSESLLGQAKSGVKSKTSKSKAKLEKMRYGSAEDFQDGAGLQKSVFSGKKGTMKAQTVPGPLVAPFAFGQTNPFALKPVGVAPSATLQETSCSALPGGYVGFGLSTGLPPGTKWGGYSVSGGRRGGCFVG
ncbi:hypothetical protein AVEN_209514-1 [Araneus ventricosus]|uniref:Uncharacterized protein n=1 Tax=Araneus ventricosus TaxID=182803 RepID=A0A4Y2ING7_ARAVE|nr:hypothetical protein AVEN_209514-1 [Araneus ventricosus]